MSRALYRIRGIVGIALSWSLGYAAAFAVIALFVQILRPQDIDPGEEPIVFVGIGLAVAVVAVALARKATQLELQATSPPGLVDRMLADLLQAACGSNVPGYAVPRHN